MSSVRKMTPIVFWTSWMPCPSAMAVAETVCASRKPRLSGPGRPFRKIHSRMIMNSPAPKKPTTGEITIGIRIFSRTPSHCTPEDPAIAAPMRPPNRACEDDDGSPKYQVSRFQVIAPSSPDRTMTRPC